MITIALIRSTNLLTDAEVQSIAVGLQFWHDEHFGPAWGTEVAVIYVLPGQSIPAGAWQLWLQDRSPIPADLAFHDVESGVPFGRCYVDDADADGTPRTVPVSHELAEMLINPFVTGLVPCVLNGVAGTVEKECADAIEDPRYAVAVEGRSGDMWPMTAFVLPSWFDPHGRAPFSWPVVPEIDRPFALAPGGYIPFQPNGGEWTQIMADEAGPMQVRRDGSRFQRLRDGLGSMGTGA